MADPLETSELLAFAKTVESRSLSRAASELRIPRATVSRRLARLEERLSTRLLRRTTRSMVLTAPARRCTDMPASCSTPSSTRRTASSAPTAPSAAICACRLLPS